MVPANILVLGGITCRARPPPPPPPRGRGPGGPRGGGAGGGREAWGADGDLQGAPPAVLTSLLVLVFCQHHEGLSDYVSEAGITQVLRRD